MISSDPDLDMKVKKTSEKISENLHIVANEPSLAFYRIQEHVRKVMPMIVDRRAEVVNLQNDLQGHCYDMEYAIGAIKAIEETGDIFKNLQDIVKRATFVRQQLKYEENRRQTASSSNQNSSVYKRLSAHLQTTLDFPDLDISGVMRETTNRVENIMRSGPATAASESTHSDVIPRSKTTLQ